MIVKHIRQRTHIPTGLSVIGELHQVTTSHWLRPSHKTWPIRGWSSLRRLTTAEDSTDGGRSH